MLGDGLTLTVFEVYSVAPVPVYTHLTVGSHGVIDTDQTLASVRVTAPAISHINVTTTSTGCTITSHLIGVTIETILTATNQNNTIQCQKCLINLNQSNYFLF